jgi:hypothetical protein
MVTIKVNTDRVDIPFTKNNAFQFVDLASLVSPDAAGVFLEERNDAAGNNFVMGKASNDLGQNQEDNLHFLSYGTHFVGFPEGNKFVSLRGINSTSNIYIRAELFEPDFVFRSRFTLTSVPKTFVDGQINQWIDQTVTPLGSHLISDITGVIVTRASVGTNFADWGIREKGSTDVTQVMNIALGSAGTDLVGVDANGQYQLYAGGKDADPDRFDVDYWETGYVTRNGLTTITNPVDENVADTSGVYTDLDLSGTVPQGATEAILSWRNNSALAHKGHARPSGSTDPNTSMSLSPGGRVTGIVSLTDAGLAEYMIGTTVPKLFVHAYFRKPTPSVTAVNIKGNNLLIKGGNLLIK